MSFEEVIDQVLILPVEQRSRLAGVLISSLEDDSDGPLSPEWLEEIEKRARDLEEGSVKGLTLSQFEAQVVNRLA